MSVGQETLDLSENLSDTQDNVRDAKRPVTSARETAQDAEDILGVFEDIANRADDIEDTLESLARLVEQLGKVPKLKKAADAFSDLLKDVANYAERFEDRARDIQKKIDPIENKVEAGRKQLESFEEQFDSVDDGIGSVRDSVDSAAQTIDQIADFSVDAALSIDALAAVPNDAVEELNDLYDQTRDRANQLLNALNDDTGIVDEIKQIQRTLESIADTLAFLREPLAGINAVLKPVEWALDAADLIYETVVSPVLDPILEAVGINSLFDEAEAFIRNLLPDINLLDDAQDYLEDVSDAIDIDLDTSFIGRLTDPLEDFVDGIVVELLDPFSLEQGKNPPTSGDDVLFGDEQANTVDGGAGDDVISGGSADDTLRGGAGEDLLLGGAGNDDLDGGDGDDAAVYGDVLSNYYVARDDESNTLVQITHDSPRNVNRDDGIDDLVAIENFVFEDISVTLDDLSRFRYADSSGVLFGTSERDFLFGRFNAADTLYGYDPNAPGADTDPTDDDYLAGRSGNDTLLGGGGNDLLDGGTGRDTLDGGLGIDTANFLSETGGIAVAMNASLPTEAKNTNRISTITDTLISIENVVGSDDPDTIFGDDGENVITGEGGSDWIHGFGGNDEIFGGDGSDRLAGGRGNDVIDAGGGTDTIGAGAGNDRYDGGADFDNIYYTSDRSFIPTEASDDVAAFIDANLATGIVRKFNAQGDPVGVDTIANIESLDATDGDDRLTIALVNPNSSTSISGRAGDDTFFAPDASVIPFGSLIVNGDAGDDVFHMTNRVLARGGDGDDTFFATDFDGDAFGDDGRDTLDFSQSSFGWRLSLNSGAQGTALPFLFAGQATTVDQGIAVRDVEVLVGSDFDDEFRAPNATSVTPSMEIFGGGGNDTIIGGNKGTTQNPGGTGDQLFGGAGDDYLEAGYARNQKLFGGTGNDVLNASPGVVQVNGQSFSAPEVEMNGGAGDDRFEIGRGEQVVIGGTGIDTIDFFTDDGSVAVAVDLALGGEIDTNDNLRVDGDEYVNIENVWGSTAGDRIFGNDKANLILGHDGQDELHGRGGDDVIYGHEGSDEIFGGDGNDLIHGGEEQDFIDGGDGSDTISYAPFTLNGDTFNRINDKDLLAISADLQTGIVLVPGSGGIGRDDIINIENVIGSVADDEIFGNSVRNVLNGSDGDDLIEGRGGRDVLLGGDGDDILRGGTGDDTILTGAGNDEAIGGSGFDTLDYSGNAGGLVFDATARTVTKTDLVETPVWEDLGSAEAMESMEQRLWRPNPSDSLRAITPQMIFEADPLNANSPDDLDRDLPNSSKTDDQGRDLGIDVVIQQVTSTDTYSGIERLIGGAGDDTLLAGDGAVNFDGGAGADTVSLANKTTGVSANLAAGTFSSGDRITNVENVVGSGFADTLVGDANDNDLNGGNGRDELTGGAGDDTLRGGGGGDTLTGGAGNDVMAGGVGNDTLLAGSGDDRLFGGNGRDFLAGASGDDRLVGGDGADELLGAAGDDQLEGDAGDDSLNGGAGNDTLFGGGGDDELTGLTGNDTLNGGSGNDLLLGARGRDVLNGGSGDDTLNGGFQSDTLLGGDGNDQINAGDGNDDVQGGAGNDVLGGQDGADVVLGGIGNDTVNGGGGNDRLEGGAGNDTLNGGQGNDVLVGGEGRDDLRGNAGEDTFVFRANEVGGDTVLDFAAGETVRLENFGYGSVGEARSDFSQFGNDVLFSNAGVAITFKNAQLSDIRAGVEISGAQQSPLEQSFTFEGLARVEPAPSVLDPGPVHEPQGQGAVNSVVGRQDLPLFEVEFDWLGDQTEIA